MFVILTQGQRNRMAVAAEELKNGDTVLLKATGLGTDLKAVKQTVAGGAVDGFATVFPTDPKLYQFAQTLAEFQATADGFAAFAETLKKDQQLLIEQGVGLAETDRIVAGTYQFGDDLVANGDGRLKKKSAAGQHIVAKVQENTIKKDADGKRVKIQYHANLPRISS